MRAVLLRRVIVFGVCALGVGGLYLAPSMARSPEQIGSPPRLHDRPTPRPQVTVTKTTTATQTARTTRIESTAKNPERSVASSSPSSPSSPVATSTEPEPAPDDTPTPAKRATQPPARAGATAVDPNNSHDDTPPQPVPELSVAAVTPDTLTIRWAAARDDVGVVSYRVWLNGFPVATTEQLQATVDWFNDEGGQHVVQVRALDAAGNQSQDSPSVLITRPEAPRPTVTPTPDPQPSDTPAAQQTPDPSPDPSAQPTAPPTDPSNPSDGKSPGRVGPL